jgi:hypothetical protein
VLNTLTNRAGSYSINRAIWAEVVGYGFLADEAPRTLGSRFNAFLARLSIRVYSYEEEAAIVASERFHQAAAWLIREVEHYHGDIPNELDFNWFRDRQTSGEMPHGKDAYHAAFAYAVKPKGIPFIGDTGFTNVVAERINQHMNDGTPYPRVQVRNRL